MDNVLYCGILGFCKELFESCVQFNTKVSQPDFVNGIRKPNSRWTPGSFLEWNQAKQIAGISSSVIFRTCFPRCSFGWWQGGASVFWHFWYSSLESFECVLFSCRSTSHSKLKAHHHQGDLILKQLGTQYKICPNLLWSGRFTEDDL